MRDTKAFQAFLLRTEVQSENFKAQVEGIRLVDLSEETPPQTEDEFQKAMRMLDSIETSLSSAAVELLKLRGPMTTHDEDHSVYIDQAGKLQCVSGKAVAALPESFDSALTTICAEMQLALDCIRIFGAVPIPVAKAILRDMEPAQAAIDMAVRCANTKESEAN